MAKPKSQIPFLDCEWQAVKLAFNQTIYFGHEIEGDGTNRKKNSHDSLIYRQQANHLYQHGERNSKNHEQILQLYSLSVALAPNQSNELAYAYGNRSALLLRLKKYEDCMKDCDLALEVTNSDELKAKLLHRKVQCLAALKDDSMEKAYNDALNSVSQMNLDDSMKDKYSDLLKASKTESNKDAKDVTKKPKPDEELPSFIPSKEAPCASEAVAIKYNETWGRHIVATRDINPGEIIAIEKTYFNFIFPEKMYLYCQYCSKFVWSSIPCKHCIYGVYCSEECWQKAWDVCHKWECDVLPHLWDIHKDIKGATSALRLLLIAIHEVGGIDQLKKEAIAVQKSQDPRTRGFSDDGIFDSSKFRSILGLTSAINYMDFQTQMAILTSTAVPIYFLATCTTFFGEKLPKKLYYERIMRDDILFIGSVLARLYTVMPRNSLQFVVHLKEFKIDSIGFAFAPFCSLINHSCDPNAKIIQTKNNEAIVFAKQPIKKGDQIFHPYHNMEYFLNPKTDRHEKFDQAFHFSCKCIACKKNWTPMHLRSAEDILKNNRHKAAKLVKVMKEMQLSDKEMTSKSTRYNPESVKKLATILNAIADNASVNCREYEAHANCLIKMFKVSFGTWHVIPKSQ